ncbi:MAG: hypothetical protein NZ920_02345 [Aigarchaeota archaeon]|nr:hypothetical protein [Aigarchaeota archaeon]MDW8092534.1 hypothetical protein [Nitrososphaerota archaeon]
MSLGQRERIELLRQGILHRAVVPLLEMRGFFPSNWRRPISLEDLELREDGWVPVYSQYTTWETYVREHPLHVFFNTYYGDVYERAYRHCFVEFILPFRNEEIDSSLIGLFTRLNLKEGGYVWKNKQLVDISDPKSAVAEIENHYDQLLLEVINMKSHKEQRSNRSRAHQHR